MIRGRQARRRLGPLLGLLLVGVGLLVWALASPVGATPDEDYHLISTWCGQGLEEGVCEDAHDDAERAVPVEIVYANCYAYQPDDSATCQADVPRDPGGDGMYETGRGNWTGDYPPVFFAFTHLFVGADVATSVLAMRVANVLVFLGLVTATYLASPPGLRRALVGGLVATSVPLGVFLVPSINPSGWAVLSAATFVVALVGFMTARTVRSGVALAVIAALALLVGAGSRADSAMYAVVAVGVALVLTVRLGRASLLRAAYPAALAVVAAVSFLTAGQSSAVEAAAPRPFTVAGFAGIVLDVPSLWVGAVGGWGLGWLDTPMPPVVWVSMWGVLAAVVFGGLDRMTWRRALALLAVAGAVVVVPAYLQFLSGAPVGAFIQPRYILPLLVLLAVTALLRTDGAAFRLAPAQRWLLVAVVAGANLVALHRNIRRYVTGLDVESFDLDAGIEWWWGIPLSPMATWLLGSAAFAAGLVLVTAELTRPAPAAGVELPAVVGPAPAPASAVAGDPGPERRDRGGGGGDGRDERPDAGGRRDVERADEQPDDDAAQPRRPQGDDRTPRLDRDQRG